MSTATESKTRVGFFVSCLVDLYRPNVGFASIELLEQAGCEVAVPESQTCCGQPAYNSGDTKSTRNIAKATIKAFEPYDYVVAPSGSCAAMIKHHYPELFTDDPEWSERANNLGQRVFELTQFLVDVMQVDLATHAFTESVTYHDSCSGLRELDIKTQPRTLLSTVSNVSVREMEDTDVCCGFGGTFCVKFPDISERMVSDKSALAKQTGATVLTGGDLGCLLNISGRMQRLDIPMRVYHVAEILAGKTNVPAIGEPSSGDPTSVSKQVSSANAKVNDAHAD